MQRHSPTKEKAPTAYAAEAIPNCKTIITLPESGCKFSLPSSDTLDAVVLAVMLSGRTISPLEAISSNLHMTRLANQVFKLRHKYGLKPYIYDEPLPLTKAQQRLTHATPFRTYWLDAGVVNEAALVLREWLQEVISKFEIKLSHYPKRNALQGVANA